jgi:thiol-disulfide isomerase/thioredoxin
VPQGINQGAKARDFTFESLDGSNVSLSDHEGSVVLVNLWATWCSPCRAEIPDLEAAYQSYKDEGFVILGVNVQEPQENVAPFVQEFDMSYPVLLDKDGELMKTYRAQGLPMSFIVDADGVIQVRHMGYLTGEQLESYLANLLP